MAFDVYALVGAHVMGFDSALSAIGAAQDVVSIAGYSDGSQLGFPNSIAIANENVFVLGDSVSPDLAPMLRLPSDLSAGPSAFGSPTMVQPPPGVFGTPAGTPVSAVFYQVAYDPVTGLLVATSQYSNYQTAVGDGVAADYGWFLYGYDPSTGAAREVWWPAADNGPSTYTGDKATAGGGKYVTQSRAGGLGTGNAIRSIDIASGATVDVVTGTDDGNYHASVLADGRIAVAHVSFHALTYANPVTVTFYAADGTEERALSFLPSNPTGFWFMSVFAVKVDPTGSRIYIGWVNKIPSIPQAMLEVRDATTGLIINELAIPTSYTHNALTNDPIVYDFAFSVVGSYAMPTPNYIAKPGQVAPQYYSYGPVAATSAGRNVTRGTLAVAPNG